MCVSCFISCCCRLCQAEGFFGLGDHVSALPLSPLKQNKSVLMSCLDLPFFSCQSWWRWWRVLQCRPEGCSGTRGQERGLSRHLQTSDVSFSPSASYNALWLSCILLPPSSCLPLSLLFSIFVSFYVSIFFNHICFPTSSPHLWLLSLYLSFFIFFSPPSILLVERLDLSVTTHHCNMLSNSLRWDTLCFPYFSSTYSLYIEPLDLPGWSVCSPLLFS